MRVLANSRPRSKRATGPSHGQLLLNSTRLRASRTFTQADINAGRLSYRHDGSETTSDRFAYTVLSPRQQRLPRQTFFMTVTPALASNASTLSIPTNFRSAAYRSENIFWESGNAPNSVSPPNPQLGTAKGNCTWFAYGRLRELGYSTSDLNKLNRDAEHWDDLAVSAHIPIDKLPAVGAIAQFNGRRNHVAVVENINADGTIVLSESSYAPGNKSRDFLYRTRTIAASSVDNFIHVRR